MESSNLYQNDNIGNDTASAGIYLNDDFDAADSSDPIYGNIGAGEDMNMVPNQYLAAASEKVDPIYGNIEAGEGLNTTPNQHLSTTSDKVEKRSKPNRQKNPRNPVKSRHSEDMYSLADIPKDPSRGSVAFNAPSFNKTKDNDSSSDGGFCSDMLRFGSKKFYMLIAIICI